MSIVRALILAVSLSSIDAYEHFTFAQSGAPPSTPITTVVTGDWRLRTTNAGLRIVIRDADAPDQPIDQAYIVVSRLDSSAGPRPPRGISSDSRGMVAAVRVDSGEYSVLVRRIGYREARFKIHLRPNCEQILEVYIARSGFQIEGCMARTVGSPPCAPYPPPTPSRVVLICGGLLIRSFRRIQQVDLGYDPNGVVSVMLMPPPRKYDNAVDAASELARLLRAVQSVQGVTSAALIDHLPGTGGVPTRIVVPGRGGAVAQAADVGSYRSVSAGYFRTMRIPLVHGRVFTDDDIRSPGDGIVVSQSVAERYWPGRDPTGEPITIFGSSQFRPDYGLAQPSHVIGVVADVKVLGPEGAERHADVDVLIHARTGRERGLSRESPGTRRRSFRRSAK